MSGRIGNNGGELMKGKAKKKALAKSSSKLCLIIFTLFTFLILLGCLREKDSSLKTENLFALKSKVGLKEKSVKIFWDKVLNCDGYKVYKHKKGENPAPITTLPPYQTYFEDENVEPSEVYIYTVEAYEGQRIVAKDSIEVSTPPPPSISSMKITQISSNLVYLTWEGNEGVYLYEISRVRGEEKKVLARFPKDITFYPDGGVFANAHFCWYIKAKSAWGEDTKKVCAETEYISSEEEAGLTPRPSELKVMSSEGGVILLWEGEGIGFKILRCEVEEEEGGKNHCGAEVAVGVAPEGATTYTDEFVEEGKYYCFRVQAYGEGGDSEPSTNIVCAEIGCGERFFLDLDGDGWGSEDYYAISCGMPEGGTSVAGDCNDRNPMQNPSAIEICDGIDNNCDGKRDFVWEDRVFVWEDRDGDGYGGGVSRIVCGDFPEGYTFVGEDCDDGNSSVNPSAAEVCDGLDNDCDGTPDEGCPCPDKTDYATVRECYTGPVGTEGIGECRAGIQWCEGGVWGECKGQVLPRKEVCDCKDNDCDGKVDEADKVISFERVYYRGVLSGIRKCAQTNPDYPYYLTSTTHTYTFPCDGTMCVYSGVDEYKIYIINSVDEWNELCKNAQEYQNIITNYVNFSTQTVLGIEFVNEVRCPSDGLWIARIKVAGDVLYIGWNDLVYPGPYCLAVVTPPSYDIVATEEKLYPSQIVMRVIERNLKTGKLGDFCPYTR